VIAPPDLPSHQHAGFIRQGIYEQLLREKTAEREKQDKRERAEAIAAELQRVSKENEAKRAAETEARREQVREQFTERLVRTFFEECPWANDEDWRRNKTAIRDQIIRELVVDRFRGRETSVNYEKSKLKESGDYVL
jgi:hypothetical protein